MADFSSLKQTIQSYIKQNGNEEITGNILQDVLLAMVSTMGDSAINSLASALQDEITARQNQDGTLQGNITAETTARQQADTALGGRIDGLQTAINGINTKLAEGYIYAGIATPSTNPGTPSGKVFYIAVQAGTYTNFGGTVVAYGINILKNNGSTWSLDQMIAIDTRPKKASQNLVTSGGVFDNIGALDVSELNATENPHTLAQYADLSAALAAIPTDYQKGGMSIKFVQTFDNKYVQYRLISDSFNTTLANWQKDASVAEASKATRIFNPTIYGDSSHPDTYEGCIDELWLDDSILDSKNISYVSMLSYGTEPYRKVSFTFSSGMGYGSLTSVFTCMIDAEYENVQNGDIVPIKVTTAGTSGLEIGTIVGYVIFSNLATIYVTQAGTSQNFLNLPYVKNIANSQTLFNEAIKNGLQEATVNIVPNPNYNYIAFRSGQYTNFSATLKLIIGDAVLLQYINSQWQARWLSYPQRIYVPIKFTEQSFPIQYEECVSELYIDPTYLNGVDFVAMWAFGTAPYRKINLVAGKGTLSSYTSYFTCKIDAEYENVQDGDIVPFKVTSGGTSGLAIGTVVGYVIFKDIASMYGHLAGTPASWLNIPYIKNIANFPTIYKYNSKDSDKFMSIQIPDIVYAIVGTELNIWNDTIALSTDKGLQSPANYKVSYVCSKGEIHQRGFRFLPQNNDVGEYSCVCSVYDLYDNLIQQKTFTIKVVAKDALSASKRIVFFGDSLGKDTAEKLYENFHDANKFTGNAPTMLGTHGTTIKYEAVGGYRWADYAEKGRRAFRCTVTGVGTISLGSEYTNNGFTWTVVEVNVTSGNGNILITKNDIGGTDAPQTNGTLIPVGSGDSIPYTNSTLQSANPLWNDNTNSLDVALYRSRLGLASNEKLDAVSFQLGLNGSTDEYIYWQIKNLYDAFIADNANCIFILGLVTSTCNTCDGYGANYGAGGNHIVSLENFYNLRELYLSLMKDAHFANLRIATPNLYIDRYYGYQFGVRKISQRFDGVTLSDNLSLNEKEVYHTNAVHPAESGYGQMADAFLAAYTAILSI